LKKPGVSGIATGLATEIAALRAAESGPRSAMDKTNNFLYLKAGFASLVWP